MVNYVNVAAERNTGSNWLCFLIDKNLDIEQGWRHGFKHWIPLKNLEDSDETLFIVLVKNPYSWLVSMRDLPHHAMQLRGLKLGDFVERKWPKSYGKNETEIQGRHAVIERNAGIVLDEEYANITQMRNHKNRYYLELLERVKHVEFVRYEDLLKEFRGVVGGIACRYGIRLKGLEIVGHDRYFEGGSIKQKNFPDKKYFLEGKYMREYSKQTLDFVNAQLDWRVEGILGYKKETHVGGSHGVEGGSVKPPPSTHILG